MGGAYRDLGVFRHPFHFEPVTHWFRTSGVPTSHWPIAVHTSFEVFVWIVATPLLFAVLDRTPVMRGVRVRHVAVRLVLAAVATVVHAALSRGALFALIQVHWAQTRGCTRRMS